MVKSKSFVLFTVLLIVLCSFSLSFASSYSTYGSLNQNSSQVTNLISYASNYDGFFESDYVVAQTGQYEYILAYGDLDINSNNIITGSASIIRYSRGTDNQYRYYFIDDGNFSLSVVDSVISSIPEVGGGSSLYSQLKFYHFGIYFFILLVALSFVRIWVRR